MKIVKVLFTSVIVYLAFPALAQDPVKENTEVVNATESVEATEKAAPAKRKAPSKPSTGYVSDDLHVFTHAGAGNNYRIMGRLAAGSEIKLTGNSDNDFAQLIDERKRPVWVETQYLSKSPGLRSEVKKLDNRNGRLSEKNSELASKLSDLKAQVSVIEAEKVELNRELAEVNKLLVATKSKLRDEDTNIKTQWFYNGSIVMGIGLLLGLILPRLGGRKRSNANSWK